MSAPAPRALVAVYVLFAIAAGARAAFQIASRLAHAPVPYGLSALAAAVYAVAAATLHRASWPSLRIARAALLLELAGVLAVGTLTVLDPGLFPDDTVWTRYGQGYGYVPLALPIIGLAVIGRLRAGTRAGPSDPVGRPPRATRRTSP